MSALQIPKQVIPFNNNTNVTTTKGIARALTNSTSPQSDSENRPMLSSVMNGAPPKPGHVMSPGNQFKQSTISFNNKKSPHSMLKVNEKVFPDIASSSSSDSSPYSSDDEVLLVTQQKKEEPLKPAKVINQASAKPKPSPASKQQLNLNSGEKPKKKPKLPITPASNGKTNGFKSDEKPLKNKNSESGDKPKKPKKLKLDGHEKLPEKSSSGKSEKPKKDKEKDPEKKSKKISSGNKPQPTLDHQKPLKFVISSDEDEPLCNLGKAKSESEKSTDSKLTNGSLSDNVPKPVKKPKPKKKPEEKPEKSASDNSGDVKPIIPMSVDSSDSDDNEDIPLSVIKLKSPVSLKNLKTKPFSPAKSSKAKAAQNLMNKHFSTTADKGKLKVEYQQPPIISKLVKLLEGDSWRDDPDKQKRVKHLVTHSAKVLSAFERERIPAVAKQLILDKRKDLDEKERWKNLTPEQRECELKAKRLEKQRQLQLLKAEAPPKPVLIKQDDLLHENVRPLPKPTQIKLPEGVSMKMYGDVLMVIEFMQIFRGILSPDDSYELNFNVSFLLEALSVGSDGFLFLSSIVEALLKSLLQDQVNEMLVDLETNLSHVTVTCHSVSDMCRLYLNHVLNDKERLIGFTPEPSLFSAAEKLKAMDFVDLSAEEKLAIITFFVNEILKTEVYEMYLQDRQSYYTDCSRWKMRANQDYQKLLKEKQDKEADLNAKKAEIIAKASEQVYGEQSAETASTVVSASTEMDEDKFLTIAEEHAILTSSMSRRQQEMELSKLRKDREERFKKIKLEQEIEESKIFLEKEKSDAEFEKISALVGKLSRLTPIGYDRFHNKYWILDCVPGILVERCWASDNISYETPTPPKEEPNVTETQSQDQNSDVASSVENPTAATNGQTTEATVKKEDESSEIQVIKSIITAVSQSSSSTNMPLKHFTRQEIPPKLLPRVGPNNWVVYDTVDQLDALMKRLFEWGNRECVLRNDLRKHIPIVRERLVSKKLKDEAKAGKILNNQPTQSVEKPPELVVEENKDGSSQNAEVKEEAKDVEVIEEEEEEKLPVIPKKFKDHYLSYLQSDMKDVHLRLFNGGLSWGNPEAIENQFDSAKSMEDIKQCMVRLYECVIPKFLTGVCKADSNQLYAAEKQWNLSSSPERTTLFGNDSESLENGDGNQSDFEKWCERQAMKRLPEGAKQWQQEVITAHTWSRLHVLLGIFDTCVRWEKSVAKSGCTVCRKKTNEDQTLLCDECNRAYHMYCLRPVLKEVPQGDWLCPGCRPKERRNSEKPAPKYNELSDDEKKKKEESSESEEWCFCCSDGGDELVMCSTCPRVFHLNCHQPPMRRVPRGTWSCMVCQNPKLKKKRGFLQTERKGDDDQSYNSDESSESSRSNYSRVKKRAKVDDSDTEEEEQSVRRSSRSNKANLYKATLVRGTKGKYAESEGSESEEESSRHSSRNGRSGGNESAESSENEADVKRTRRSAETKSRRRLGSTSNEASPERDSVDAKRSRSSKRKRDEDSDSEKEAASKKQKKSQEVNANQAKENYEVEEVAEEVDICEKIFLDIKSRTQFMFFENIAEVDAYSGVENRVDFSTIQTTMEEKGYIWKGFIRDLAFIVNNALQAFEESHKVHRAALKMDERMRNLLAKLPIMLNRYSKIREGVPESTIEKEEKEREDQLRKENADVVDNKQEEENGEGKKENEDDEEQDMNADDNDDDDSDIQEPSCNGREQRQLSKQDQDDNQSDADDHDYKSSRDNSRGASRDRTPERTPRKFHHSSDPKKPKFRPSYGGSSFDRSELLNDEDEASRSSMSTAFRSLSKGRLFNDDSSNHGQGRVSPGFADNDDDSSRVDSLAGGSGKFGGRFQNNPAAMFMEFRNRRLPCHFKVVEVEAEVDACAKMLHRFKHLSGLSYFVNVSDVAAYAGIRRKADFMKMEQKMKKKGYVWQGFVADLALIVNNALVAFQPKEAVYKAGIRLDKKVLKTLDKFPHMISHYQYMRKQANEFLEDDDDEMCLAQLKKPPVTSAGVVSKEEEKEGDKEGEAKTVIDDEQQDDDDDGHDEDDDDDVLEKMRTRKVGSVKETRAHREEVKFLAEKPATEDEIKEQQVDSHNSAKTSEKPTAKTSPLKEIKKEMAKPIKSPEKKETRTRQQELLQLAKESKTCEKDATVEKSPDVQVKHSTPKEKSSISKRSPEPETPKEKSTTIGKLGPEPEVKSKKKPSIKALFSDTDKSSDENKEKLLDKVNKSPTLENQPTTSKTATPKKDSTPAAVVKSSLISFFKEDESTECIALCRKIFNEIGSKSSYSCFRSSEMSETFKTVEKSTNFDEIEAKIQSNDYTWNDFLADIACIINNALFLFKPEESVYKVASKLDSKMISYLRSVSSMKRSYEEMRKITPLLRTTIQDVPSNDDPAEQSSDKLPPTTVASPGIESATLFNETVESTLKTLTESEKSGDEAKGGGTEFESLNTESKVLTARTLDKSEIQKLCVNLFMELKADENLVCLKYLTKDSVCQTFAKKTDFAKIEKKLSRPGYIWGKFVKDLAAVTYIAMNLYPKESGVYQAGLSLNWKMETSLKKFPVMLNKFSRSRDDPLETGSTSTKESATSSSAMSEATIANSATSITTSTNDDEDKEENISANATISSAKQSKPDNKSKQANIEKSHSNEQTSSSAAKKLKTEAETVKISPTLEKSDVTKSPAESSKSKEERIRKGAALELEEEIVIDEDKAICSSILDSLRQTEQFACFENISKEYLDEMTDFESIANDLQKSTYKASNFVKDLAALVNRAMKQFRNVEPELFSAAMRLDVRLLSLLYQVPHLRDEYRQVRSQKVDSSSPLKTEKQKKQDSKSQRSPESPKRAKLASSPDAKTKHKKDNRSDSGFFDQSISKVTNKHQSEPKVASEQVSDAAGTPERSTSKSPERTPNANSLKTSATKVQKVEVDEEVDICNKILQDIKSKHTFQVFQNVSEVPNYLSVSKRVDLMGIESRMGESGYIWAKFIRDMAIIVNNALVVFEDSHTVHKAALKLDARMLHLMQRLPIMKGQYEKTRSEQKTSSESPEQQQQSSIVSKEVTPERNVDENSQDDTEDSSMKPMYVPEFKKVKKSPNKKSKLMQEGRASPRTESPNESVRSASSPNRSAKVITEKTEIKFDKQVSLKLARIDVESPKREHISPKQRTESKSDGSESGNKKAIETVKAEPSSPQRVSTQISAIASAAQSGDDRKRSVSPSHSKSSRNEEQPVKPTNVITVDSDANNITKSGMSESSSTGAKKSSLPPAAPPASTANNSSKSSEEEATQNSLGATEAASSVPGSPNKTGKSSGASRLVVVKEEVDEVVDICEKIFLDIRTKTSFIVFENVECVPAYSQVSRKADFSSIERQMPIKNYIWKEFIADMATIVNNAHSVFDGNHKAYKAATRMDQRLRHIMRNLPIMLAHYNTIREQCGQKITSEKQDD